MLHKKGGTVTALDYAGALDEALCFGWIDGVIGRRDDGSYLTRFTPRTRTSKWSKNNVENIARLSLAGRMQPAGKAAVNAAKADGRWEAACEGQSKAELPADLAGAIAANPRAQAMFAVLTAVNRFALIHRTTTMKNPAARAAKIERFVGMPASGETPYPQKRRPG